MAKKSKFHCIWLIFRKIALDQGKKSSATSKMSPMGSFRMFPHHITWKADFWKVSRKPHLEYSHGFLKFFFSLFQKRLGGIIVVPFSCFTWCDGVYQYYCGQTWLIFLGSTWCSLSKKMVKYIIIWYIQFEQILCSTYYLWILLSFLPAWTEIELKKLWENFFGKFWGGYLFWGRLVGVGG